MEQESFDLLIKKNGSKNLSWMTHRLSYDKDDIENALSKHWVLENKKKLGINFGKGILQDLFYSRLTPNSIFTHSHMFLKINNRDRIIAATVIQWLGTNCGFCWLQEALSKAGYDIVKRK